MTTKEINLPLRLTTVYPLNNLGERKKNRLEDFINDLLSINNEVYLQLNIYGKIYLNFKFVKKVDFPEFGNKHELYLVIESTAEIDFHKISEQIEFNSELDKQIKPEQLVLPYFRVLYNAQLRHFLKFTQISHPGTIWLGAGFVYLYDKLIDKVEGISSILEENDFLKDAWPEKTTVKIIEVWNYILNKTTLLEKFSSTKIERALCSFTYLFSDSYHSDIPVALFWAISGLEALFVEGDTGITQQLNDKIPVFLGEIETDKKRLKKLYNFRSSLIHGGLSIPIKEAIINDEKHKEELYEMSTLSSFILVASLQKIIKNDLKELKFKYTF
ncbi:hypothetical protein [Lacihabitans soyangensis]|uniref:Apea-like HEPN domain-containing protein n=1 Tax=Lacihabitans soyangensis TaxID=869394 RepID=A0AAE3GZF1_9BACT|nr:hypothetical protein [Lacihabitans soyangensis]MCP9762018.1 hypothetical protein [Lacihabitans soyangensis]